ncbi:oxygen-insensitive NADPH nitroreductase [Bacillus sp. FJAT-42376]|uniref:oxygen-insensitive NADPH nitroreductase n=1 Tax=Bacillus sp. FJAT-42376 TaxID=2014076 RepID=UPI000F4DB118|nr:oxygen-insensitive NADPH nitroreductase [Bacillus sp. FJAT-42376]AZB40976.1 oxygen-insensitive NADPH nitroreductase [Bacillus sp. FJAT-42376]
MNSTIETILKHRSIRQFEDRPLTDEQISLLVKAAQAASTSSNIQAYSIIGVKNPAAKEKLAELAGGQSYVAHNGHFFVFCADLYRHQKIGEMENMDVTESLESTEKFMVALIDAALAAQNTAVAAESMGLGICYIGGLRNNLPEVAKVLKTPERVIPLFGMAIGYPDQNPDVKPRLPFEHLYFEEQYDTDPAEYEKQLNEYNETVSSYYKERTGGERSDTWTGQMAQMLSHPQRMYMKEFVEKNGLNKQ